MAILVFIEREEGKIRKASYEAVSYAMEIAGAIGDRVVGTVFGSLPADQLNELGKYGCHRVIHVSDIRLDRPMIRSYADVLVQLIESEDAEYVVMAQSSLADPVAAMAGIRTGASVATNITSVPDITETCVLQRSIYSGKAYEDVRLTGKRKILSIRKNACGIKENDNEIEIVESEITAGKDQVVVTLTGMEKAKGDILLSEAEIVVSGGRGLKGPENWSLIEDLAEALGAALGCSKPVSDAGWRPHHEHVGQTGIKVSPDLYVAAGISGAIQHLAGVSSSKYILVINNDPEAPFFKSADYGIVGDAFKVIPALIEAIRKHK